MPSYSLLPFIVRTVSSSLTKSRSWKLDLMLNKRLFSLCGPSSIRAPPSTLLLQIAFLRAIATRLFSCRAVPFAPPTLPLSAPTIQPPCSSRNCGFLSPPSLRARNVVAPGLLDN